MDIALTTHRVLKDYVTILLTVFLMSAHYKALMEERMDSTSSVMVAVNDIMTEWLEIGRKGSLTIHCDGRTFKKIEFNYQVNLENKD